MADTATSIMEELIQSFSQQCALYTALIDISQKILGTLTLNRGDFSRVINLFEEKQKILDNITYEREKSGANIAFWEKNKTTLSQTALTSRFNAILGKTEDAIREYLDIETQVQTYISFISKKGDNPIT